MKSCSFFSGRKREFSCNSRKFLHMVAFSAGCIRPCRAPVGGLRHLSSVSFHSGGTTLALLPRLRSRESRANSFAITCQDGSTKKQFENWTTDAYKEESRRFRRTVSQNVFESISISIKIHSYIPFCDCHGQLSLASN